MRVVELLLVRNVLDSKEHSKSTYFIIATCAYFDFVSLRNCFYILLFLLFKARNNRGIHTFPIRLVFAYLALKAKLVFIYKEKDVTPDEDCAKVV